MCGCHASVTFGTFALGGGGRSSGLLGLWPVRSHPNRSEASSKHARPCWRKDKDHCNPHRSQWPHPRLTRAIRYSTPNWNREFGVRATRTNSPLLEAV